MISNILLKFLILSVCYDVLAAEDEPSIKYTVTRAPNDCTIQAAVGDTVHFHFVAYLKYGEKFDGNYLEKPMAYTLGSRHLIPGLEKGLIGMCEWEERQLVIPPELGYGAEGLDNAVPPNSWLTYKILVVHIDKQKTDL